MVASEELDCCAFARDGCSATGADVLNQFACCNRSLLAAGASVDVAGAASLGTDDLRPPKQRSSVLFIFFLSLVYSASVPGYLIFFFRFCDEAGPSLRV